MRYNDTRRQTQTVLASLQVLETVVYWLFDKCCWLFIGL